MNQCVSQPRGRVDSQVFRREGEYWTIVYADTTCRLRDVKGLQYLASLLASPHAEVSALALEHRVAELHRLGALELHGVGLSDPPKSVDPDAVELGPGLHDARERARVNVTRAIAAALKRIAQHHPLLGHHLNTTVRTGTFCAYRPDPRLPIEWSM